MNTFREKYAYKVSLWMSLATSVLLLIGWRSLGLFLTFIPFALLIILILRFLSKSESKHWKDILVFLFGSLFAWFLYFIGYGVVDGCGRYPSGSKLPVELFSMVSLFNPCSKYSVAEYLGIVFSILALFFSIKYLFFKKEDQALN